VEYRTLGSGSKFLVIFEDVQPHVVAHCEWAHYFEIAPAFAKIADAASAIAVKAYRDKTRRSLAAILMGETDFLISGSILCKHS
jgi:hypothetical protein